MIGKIVGDFEIVRELGRGGMGSVYEASDRMLGRRVAIKVVHPELSRDPVLIERFQKEAQALARLNHPNVTSVYSLFRDGDQYFLVMEYVEGQPLEARLRGEGALPWKEAVDLTIGALEGLQHAHEHGIIHRDVKPANLFLPASGGIKIMDFGIAHILGQRRLTRMGTVVGTLAYMSPEQVGGRDLDARTDIYSLGIVLYEMVTGGVPFLAKSDYELMQAQLERAPTPPRSLAPSIPKWLEEEMVRALAKDPRQRHHMAAELAADLRHGLENNVAVETAPTRALNVPPPPPPTATAPPPPVETSAPAAGYTPPPVAPLGDTGTQAVTPRRLPLVPLATGALLLIAAIVVVLALLPSGSPPESAGEQTQETSVASAVVEPPQEEPPPAIMPVTTPPPPQVKEATPVAPAPVSPPPPRTSPPPPPPTSSPPPPPPPPVSTAAPAPPPPPATTTVETQSAPAGPIPSDPDDAFQEIGTIAQRLPPLAERLQAHYDEYLDNLEDIDESRLKTEDWTLESQLELLLEATERLRGAYAVAAEREGKSKKRGLRRFANRVRATWSAADRNTLMQRIDELRKERETIDGLMRTVNQDDLTRDLWRDIRGDVVRLERLKSTLQ